MPACVSVAPLKVWHVSQVLALGTAAFRRAGNASALIRVLEEALGSPIRVIDGATEALLIARGATLPLRSSSGARLILDIGGGSVECILLNGDRITWHHSFEAGVAILRSRFHRLEPINEKEIQDLRHFLSEEMKPLLERVLQEDAVELIGSAGIFETLGSVLGRRRGDAARNIPIDLLRTFTNEVSRMDLDRRSTDPRIPRNRVQHVVTALLLIDWIVEHLPIRNMLSSPYSLKEGALTALAEGWINPGIPVPPLWNNPSGHPPGVSG